MKAKRKAEKHAPVSEVRIGAPAALSRLEREERILFNAYEKAKKSGDVLTVRLARDGWLKCSEALRKYDVMLAAARRELGEVVLRSDVTRWLSHLAGWLHFSLITATGTADKGYETMWRALRGYCGEVKGVKGNADVPAWMLRSLMAEGLWREPREQLLAWRRIYHTDAAARLFPNDPKKFSAHVETAMARDTADLKEQL